LPGEHKGAALNSATDKKHRNITVMNTHTHTHTHKHTHKEIKYYDSSDILQPQSANNINAFGTTRQKSMYFVT